MMSDLLFQQISTVQDITQPVPQTIASATTISPNTFLTFVTGTAQVQTMNPFTTGAHMLVLIFTAASPTAIPSGVGAGNFKSGITPVQNLPVICIWDPISQLWWVGITELS
jgi:hypothetical protein